MSRPTEFRPILRLFTCFKDEIYQLLRDAYPYPLFSAFSELPTAFFVEEQFGKDLRFLNLAQAPNSRGFGFESKTFFFFQGGSRFGTCASITVYFSRALTISLLDIDIEAGKTEFFQLLSIVRYTILFFGFFQEQFLRKIRCVCDEATIFFGDSAQRILQRVKK